MLVSSETKPTTPSRSLPLDVYVSFVDSLFGDSRSLYVGSIGACVTSLIAAWRTSSIALLMCAVAIGAAGVGRAVLMHAYARARRALEPLRRDIRKWEIAYVYGASAHVALIGVFCLLSFALTDDPFVHLLSFAALIAYLIGAAGRNFSSSLLVNSQIVCSAAPMTIAMTISPPIYSVITIFVLLPFFISLATIAKRLRGILFDAVVRAHDLDILAKRFDTALNNMPHGLAMFDAKGRLAVSNARLADLLRLDPDAVLRGIEVDDLIDDCARRGVFPAAQTAALSTAFHRRITGLIVDDLLIDTQSERTLALKFQGMDSGGSVVVVEDVTERKSAEARISHLARFDSLTGMPNRTMFRDQVEARLRDGNNSAVMFIDLDHFKQVNDTLGHSRGDKLLCEVARRLLSVVGENDVAARFGADEFVLLHPLDQGERDVTLVAKNIIDVLSLPYRIEGHDVLVGASIGVALAPTDGTDVDQLLKNSDMALYRAKTEGRGTWRFFEPAMDVQARARREIEFDLRNALPRNEFELFFQPIFNLEARKYTVCEALIRWRHPERGMISPAEFVPIAEEMGLIVDIGSWVLHEACRQCAQWPADVRVAVNISPLQFRRGGIVATVVEALSAAGLPSHRLEIEITESVLLQNLQFTRIALYQLRELGVRISLDDFGTGYSSLSYLHTLPLQKVKIDRSFLQGLGASDRTLILLNGVARLSAELGMDVVVEGIETEEQYQLVAADGNVDEIQGYFFSRPVPHTEVMPLLSRVVAQVA